CSAFYDARAKLYYSLSLHDALPIYAGALRRIRREPDRGDLRIGEAHLRDGACVGGRDVRAPRCVVDGATERAGRDDVAGRARLRSEEHTSELQSRENLVCRLLLEKK